jgi:hypothetical protein
MGGFSSRVEAAAFPFYPLENDPAGLSPTRRLTFAAKGQEERFDRRAIRLVEVIFRTLSMNSAARGVAYGDLVPAVIDFAANL